MSLKRFLTYQQQIQLLKSKKLHIQNETLAIEYLKKYGYYSLISGYKDIFKAQKNGDYKPTASFDKIVSLYVFDDYLKNAFLREIIDIEKHIKSLYSYSFCSLFGDAQSDYLNVSNYNYNRYSIEVSNFISMVNDILNNPSRFNFVNYNITNYGTVPLWVMIQTFTFGNMSKLYMFSKQNLQSTVAKEFPNIYTRDLNTILNVLTKFRNVCAHGERLYSYKTQKSITTLPIHSTIPNYSAHAKNDLFNVLLSFKYLTHETNFQSFVTTVDEMLNYLKGSLGNEYYSIVISKMGFPENWKDIVS